MRLQTFDTSSVEWGSEFDTRSFKENGVPDTITIEGSCEFDTRSFKVAFPGKVFTVAKSSI